MLVSHVGLPVSLPDADAPPEAVAFTKPPSVVHVAFATEPLCAVAVALQSALTTASAVLFPSAVAFALPPLPARSEHSASTDELLEPVPFARQSPVALAVTPEFCEAVAFAEPSRVAVASAPPPVCEIAFADAPLPALASEPPPPVARAIANELGSEETVVSALPPVLALERAVPSIAFELPCPPETAFAIDVPVESEVALASLPCPTALAVA